MTFLVCLSVSNSRSVPRCQCTMPVVFNSISLRISYELWLGQNRTEPNGTERNRTEPRVCADAGRSRDREIVENGKSGEGSGRVGEREETGEGISSVEELRGVFFMACTTKSLTTNAKRRPHSLLPFRSEKLARTWRPVIGLLLRSEMLGTVQWCE